MRADFDGFVRCYEAGLRRNPNLAGRVTTRFVINRDGSVSNVTNAGTDLPDVEVALCVFARIGALKFPEPEGGIVTVVYPLQFAPGAGDAQTVPGEDLSRSISPAD